SIGATVVRLDAWRADRALAFPVGRAQAAGLHVELIISLSGATPPAKYARKCRTIAATYRPRGVMRVEMGHEPNLRTISPANPAPKRWVQQQLGCARAIRSAARDAHIVSGGLAGWAGTGRSPRTARQSIR